MNYKKEKLDIIVLMSTYNGEKYLDEQLKSIFNQKNVNIKVMVRDDGSNDETKIILNKWALNYPLTWLDGNNIGVGNSFMQLVYSAEKCDYYAFSDQDDVWKSDKLISGINILKTLPQEKLALYYSSYNIVDENLNILNENPNNFKPYNFGSSLLQCNPLGCSFIFNYAAKKFAENFLSENIRMHDTWMFRIVYATGNIIYDNTAHLLYRQHANNVSGANQTAFKRLKNRLKRIKSFFNGARIGSVKQVRRCCEEYITDKEKIEILKDITEYNKSFRNKLKVIFNKNLRLCSKLDTILFRIILLIGKA